MNAPAIRRTPTTRILQYAGLGFMILLAIWLASYVPAADWHTFYGAARAVFQGLSPYGEPGFNHAPWTVLLIVPFAAFPPNLGRGLVLVATVAVWLYVAWRMRAPTLAVIAMMVSPTAIGSLLAANIDAFILLGIFLPTTWGLLVLLTKPQIGVGPVVYELAHTWRTRGIARVMVAFTPVLVVYVISAVLFPVWIDRFVHTPGNVWNRSLFPYGIPLGLALLWLSWRRQNVMFALASTPFLTPYLTFPTYLIVQVGLLHPDVDRWVPRAWLQAGLCAFLWIIMLVFRL